MDVDFAISMRLQFLLPPLTFLYLSPPLTFLHLSRVFSSFSAAFVPVGNEDGCFNIENVVTKSVSTILSQILLILRTTCELISVKLV